MKIVELILEKIEEDIAGFDAVALVENPAHQAHFYAFDDEDLDDTILYHLIRADVLERIRKEFVTKLPYERKEDYISRCIPVVMDEGFDKEQATAICYSDWEGFDETEDPQEIVIGDYKTRHYDMCPGASALYRKIESQEIDTDMGIAIRAAKLQDALFYLEKHTIQEMGRASFEDVKIAELLAEEIMTLSRMMELEEEHQYIAGHVEAIRSLYLDEEEMEVDVTSLPDFINEIKEKERFESYTDYPKSATNAAKRALEWRDSHPDNDCGTRVGWARANQLANRRPISRDTIARMASFARHLQHEDVPYSEGCGGLMVDAWGGRAGIEWAKNKLDKLEQSQQFVENAGGFSVDDYVSWTYAGRGEGDDRGRGQITNLRVSGKLKVPGTDFELSPTEERPAALIKTRTGQVVGQYTENLRKIQKPDDWPFNEFSYFDDLPESTQDRLIESLKSVGISRTELEKEYEIVDTPKSEFKLPTKDSANPDEPTNDTSGRYKILYQYVGPRDSKNRDFCRRLLDLDMLFRKEDIERMTLMGANSQEFGYYDIFQYKGSYGCRHRWNKKYVYQKKGDNLLEIFSSQQKRQFSLEEDERIVVGPLMIPDKLIYRVDENNEPYYVYFSKETIEEIARKMMKEEKLDDINLEHDQDSLVDGHLIETWIVEDEKSDKQGLYNMNYPKGTWMGMYKVEDDEIWRQIKSGQLKGFSIEGYFADRVIQN